MRYRFVVPLLVLVMLSMACNLGGRAATSEPPTLEPPTVEPPTPEPPPPTQPPPEPTQPFIEEATPTAEVIDSGAEEFYKEEFEGDISFWKYFILAGSENNIDIRREAGLLKIDLKRAGDYVYVFNENATYSDVYVETRVESMGDSNNGMAVACRRSDAGWYELRISSNAVYEVFLFDQKLKDRGKNGYVRLSGPSPYASKAIKAGRNANVIGLGCYGDTLIPYINGEEVILPSKNTIVDNTLSEGWVGIGVMSASPQALPKTSVKVEYEYVDIAQP